MGGRTGRSALLDRPPWPISHRSRRRRAIPASTMCSTSSTSGAATSTSSGSWTPRRPRRGFGLRRALRRATGAARLRKLRSSPFPHLPRERPPAAHAPARVPPRLVPEEAVRVATRRRCRRLQGRVRARAAGALRVLRAETRPSPPPHPGELPRCGPLVRGRQGTERLRGPARGHRGSCACDPGPRHAA